MSIFYKLSVKEIKKETKRAVSIVFDVPSDLIQKFDFIPGQYITIKKIFKGKEIRRAYSICSSKDSGIIRIGVKSVDNGLFSVYATSELKIGDALEVSPPEGRFNLAPDTNNQKNYLAFVAGSGITPVLSMIKSVLEIEPMSKFVLVYGSKNPEDTMFKTELDDFRTRYPKQLYVSYAYSQINDNEAISGRIDAAVCNFILKNKYEAFSFDEYFLCGPEPMIEAVKASLLERGISNDNIYFELFSVDLDQKSGHETQTLDGNSEITIILDDDEETFSMPRKRSILEAALLEGLDPPYSCQGGICSSCLAMITSGKAVMDKNTILTDDEVNDGLILTCQAHPTTDKITIDYDVV
ncbi:MAG: 2Fe-2S iron-sulfur cluster-binding protein [Flavobacteriaceae bacterium]|nr:2Fe-2S iron-sulfur cluster-binding protein [Flavobacteriaceae bacterium]